MLWVRKLHVGNTQPDRHVSCVMVVAAAAGFEFRRAEAGADSHERCARPS